MIEGLRKINKSYPLATTKVEESGEHLIIGTGELYLDQIMHDLRTLYAEIEIKVSEPFVKICETVVEASSQRSLAKTSNGKNCISMMAEPLEKGLYDKMQFEELYTQENRDSLAKTLTEQFEWDELTVDSIWAFGPQNTGSNILIDYTLDGEIDK